VERATLRSSASSALGVLAGVVKRDEVRFLAAGELGLLAA